MDWQRTYSSSCLVYPYLYNYNKLNIGRNFVNFEGCLQLRTKHKQTRMTTSISSEALLPFVA